MTVHFKTAWILYLIWIIPLFTIWWITMQKRIKRALNSFVAPALQQKLFPTSKHNYRIWQIWLISIALILLLIAAAGPQWGEREETVYQQSRDLVIAVDVSRSMLANDIHPSRLQRAKIDLVDLIKELNGDRAALMAFRAKASLVCPLTTDYAFLRQALDGLSPNSAPRGATNIGDAIAKALDSFDDEDASHKAIILISDGEDLSGKAEELAKKAGEKHIPIFTVGIGSRSGSRIPDKNNRYLRHENKDVITKLNNETLYAIAKASGGSYIPVETASMTSTTLGTIYRKHLRQINARELAETKKTRAIERYQWFLFPALILLLAAVALSRGRIGKPHSRQTTDKAAMALAAITLLVWLCPLTGSAQSTNSAPLSTNNTENVEASTNSISAAAAENLKPGRKGARYAQKLFKNGKYSKAAQAYLYAAAGVTREEAREFKHNAAVALARAGKPDEAADILRELTLQSQPDDHDENLPLGITTFRMAEKLDDAKPETLSQRVELLHESGEAFKQAWRADNQSADAPHNIAVVLPKIAAAEEQAKILELTKKYAKTPAPQLADDMLKQQRELTVKIPAAITNATPDRITQLESLSEEQNTIADLWIPLKSKLAQAMQQQGSASNAQHFAALTQLMERTRDEMHKSANQLRDLDPEGFRSAKVAEHETYQLWKTVASYNMLLDEDIARQTNSIDSVTGKIPPSPYTITTTENQQECLQLTQAFQKRFEQAVPEKGTQQPAQQQMQPNQNAIGPTVANANNMSATNAPKKGISAEDRAKIVNLAKQTITNQKHAIKKLQEQKNKEALPFQQIAYKNLLEIKKLLPKQQNKNNKQNKQQNKQQKQNKQNKQQNKNKKQQNKQQNKQQQNKKKQNKQKKKQDQKEKQDKQSRDIRKILEKALEREREHKEEKERRMNQIPLPSFERDW